MAFKLEAFQNRFLSGGQTRVDAIVTVTAGRDDAAHARADVASAASSGAQLVLGFIIDTSGSMGGERMTSVVQAVTRAIQMLDERAWFFVVGFDAKAAVLVPESQATAQAKALAAASLRNLHAQGGTAMSSGLALARGFFERAPNAIRQAIFLTDGKNESESSSAVAGELARCQGVFQCDCWGVGTDWRVGEVQQIAEGLLGKASLIPEPGGVEAAFRGAIEKASAKSLNDVRLRLWTPQGASVSFVKQVNPTIDDLTAKARGVSAQVREYLTGAWSAGESRDFHIVIDVKQGHPGDEMLACRPSVAYQESAGGAWIDREDKSTEARLFATWTADDTLSSRIDDHVAHYTGQDELANAIKEGLALREQGNEAAATQLLGRAVKLAHSSHNSEMTARLSKVVEVLDAPTGTIRLKRDVKKAATMDLELESRTTKRVSRKRSEGEA